MKKNGLLKRVLSFTVAAVLTAAAMLPASASKTGKALGSVAQVEASAITVDGKKDEIYSKGLNVKTAVNADGVSANAWLVWSKGYLYVFADVSDAHRDDITADVRKTSPWTADSFEIFVDEDNDGKNYGMQYRVDFTGYGTWKDRNANKNYYTPDVLGSDFKYAAVAGATGYTAEMRVPMNAVEGAEVGINFQINGVTGTSYLVKDGWNTPEYSYIKLGALVKTAPVATAAATADMTAAVLLVSLLSGVCFIRRKK